jgi:hypothetical protein
MQVSFFVSYKQKGYNSVTLIYKRKTMSLKKDSQLLMFHHQIRTVNSPKRKKRRIMMTGLESKEEDENKKVHACIK